LPAWRSHQRGLPRWARHVSGLAGEHGSAALGELDLATAETLRTTLDVAIAETLHAALDGMEESTARVMLDLRGLSFIDSTGLHLLVAPDQRAHRDGFLLTLLAPAGPIERAIQLCGLDKVLPFGAPDDAVDGTPATSANAPQAGS
jgi:anti-sigma B factor antagonist